MQPAFTAAKGRIVERNTRYYESIASQYDEQMLAVPGSAWIRGAFRKLVTETVPPQSTLLDFGCGTGLDSVWFASQAFHVIAYDPSPAMVNELTLKKRNANDLPGVVLPCAGSMETLRGELLRHDKVDAIVSNFAVLNLLEQPHTVFAQLAPHVRPGGFFVISVLNTVFWKDLRRGATWLALLHSAGLKAVQFQNGDATHYRHRIHAIRSAAKPNFVLVRRASVGALIRRWRGPRDWNHPRTLAERIESRTWLRFPMNRLGQFLFLVFRRTP
jgi:SAM-dependent methyltransferase